MWSVLCIYLTFVFLQSPFYLSWHASANPLCLGFVAAKRSVCEGTAAFSRHPCDISVVPRLESTGFSYFRVVIGSS
jgi:hypothetical protein